MPTYEYECGKCHKSFDMQQSMKDAPLTVCPRDHCRMKTWGKGKVKRCLGTGAGLIFKGTGFYITDYRSEGYKAAAKQDSGTASSASAEPAKPAATPAKPAAAEKPAAKKKPAK
jgi:putative FmdB family regulatory protein